MVLCCNTKRARGNVRRTFTTSDVEQNKNPHLSEKPLQDVVALINLWKREEQQAVQSCGLKLTIGRTLLQQCKQLARENNASKPSVRVGVWCWWSWVMVSKRSSKKWC